MTANETDEQPADETPGVEGHELDPAQEPEPEPLGEPEPEPTPDPEPEARAPSAAELRRFERENTRHERELAKIIGAEWEHFAPCETCGGVGFGPAAGTIPLDLVNAPGVIECPTCAGAGGSTCPTCEGKGGLQYPTKVEGQRVQSCPGCGGAGMLVCVDCAGNGWKREAPHPQAVPDYSVGPVSNGTPGIPPGHILVKIDPNAPDVPQAAPTYPAPATPVAP